MTSNHLIVWDLETIPDLAAAARIHAVELEDEDRAREALGDKFPKLPLHKIACIGALVAEWQDLSWRVRSLGAPHIGERSESELIGSFVEKIADLLRAHKLHSRCARRGAVAVVEERRAARGESGRTADS